MVWSVPPGPGTGPLDVDAMLEAMHHSDGALNVMLVEDDGIDAQVAYRALTSGAEDKQVIRLIRVSRLSGALQRLQQSDDIHLVILDLGLPDVPLESEGVERIRQLRPNVPIIVWSGIDYESAGFDAIEKGANMFVPKNEFSDVSLSVAVRQTLDAYRRQRNAISVLEASPDGILIINSRRRILFANPAACRMLDLDSEQLDRYEFPLPITPHRVEVDIANDGIAEIWFEELQWDGEPTLLATMRDLTVRFVE